MESNILLVKPDSLNQQRFVDIVVDDLGRHGFEIVASGSKALSEAELNQNFIVKNGEHLDYMLSGPVAAILYRGDSAVGFGRNYKFEFRKQHKVDDIRNVLHTTEPGNEYVVQFGLFFPELDIAKYHQFTDQGVFYSSLSPSDIEKLPTLGRFNLIAENEQQFFSEPFSAVHGIHNCINVGFKEVIGPSIDLVRYHQKGGQSDGGQVRVLLLHGEVDYTRELPVLKEKHQIHGVVCYKPSYSLIETENLRYQIFENKLFCVGGSFGEKPPGHIRVSTELENIFLATFRRES
ncbi:nucleoside-diphosphate kinase [Agrobacterium rhizogenes]|nr:nucleoside-diphosphate kinase [Rhizobium rhizogenes]